MSGASWNREEVEEVMDRDADPIAAAESRYTADNPLICERCGKELRDPLDHLTEADRINCDFRGKDREARLAEILERILDWPLPNGETIESYAVPPVMARDARAILRSDG